VVLRQYSDKIGTRVNCKGSNITFFPSGGENGRVSCGEHCD